MPSFDTCSEVDFQEVDNAVNQVIKEISTRYDFRGSKSSIKLDKKEKLIQIIADDDYKLKAVVDILQTKSVKRGISLKAFNIGEAEEAAGGLQKQDIKLITGIEQEKAKKMIKLIKDSKLKVQAQIQEEKVRVSAKKRDDLQEVIGLLKSQDFGIPLQFVNYRD